MGEKPFKRSNYLGVNKDNIDNYVQNVDRDLLNVFRHIKNNPRIIQQSTEPTLTKGTFGFWKDTDDSKYYLILNIDGTQKKVELT